MSLRAKVLSGGVYLTLRRGAGMALGVIGALYITNIVGPGNYGLFTSVMGVLGYLQQMGHLGIHIYLIRELKEDSPSVAYQAFWLGLGWSLVLALGAALLLWGAGHYWVRTQGFVPVSLTMVAFLPCTVLTAIVNALLERQLDYKRVATIELLSLSCYYLVGIPLAWKGYGVWALVGGWIAQQVVALLGALWFTGFRPHWVWNRQMVRAIVQYGVSYSISNWLFHLRNLIPAFVVLPLAGREVAGYIGLARRMVELLSFAREATSRLALPALATLREDKSKMLRAINEGMCLHTLGVSVFYVPAALLLPLLVERAFKAEWNPQVIGLLFAFIASNYLVQGVFMLHSSALYAYKYNWTVALTNLSYFLLLLVGAALLLPYWGALGYGLALVATLPSFLILHRASVRLIGRPDYRVALLWLGGFSAAIFAPALSFWLYGLSILLLLHPTSLRAFLQLYKNIRAVQRQKAGEQSS